MYLRLFWIPEPLISLFLYTRSASKDYMIFEKQPALISNRINVSIKKKQFCAQNIEPWGGWKNNLLFTCTGKPQTPVYMQFLNPFQNKLDAYKGLLRLCLCDAERISLHEDLGNTSNHFTL